MKWLFLLSTIIVISGCQKMDVLNPISTKNQLIGEWYVADSAATTVYKKYEFKRKNELLVKDKDTDSLKYTCSWQLEDEHFLTMNCGGMVCLSPPPDKVVKESKNRYRILTTPYFDKPYCKTKYLLLKDRLNTSE